MASMLASSLRWDGHNDEYSTDVGHAGGQIYRGGEQSASGKNMLVMGGGGQEGVAGVAGRTERQPPTTWPSSYPLILEDSVPDWRIIKILSGSLEQITEGVLIYGEYFVLAPLLPACPNHRGWGNK